MSVPTASARTKLDNKPGSLRSKSRHIQTRDREGLAGCGELRDKKVLVGYISETKDDSFVVSDPKTATDSTVAYSDVTQVKGHNLGTGARSGLESR